MEQQPPQNDQPSTGSTGSAKSLYWKALLVGSLISAVVWIWFWQPDNQTKHGEAILIVVPAVKFVIAVACCFKRNWRPVSSGLLASMGIGFLIFFGLCAAKI